MFNSKIIENTHTNRQKIRQINRKIKRKESKTEQIESNSKSNI